ncbi:MAG TPA: hypothetical protein VIC04_04095, partial [Terriglobia bacterium]
MKFVTYKKYQPGDLDSLDLQELVNRLADFFLQSGFSSPYDYLSEMDGEQTLEQLRQAILDAIRDGDLFSDEQLQELMEQLRNLSPEQQQQVADRLIERLEEEGYISITDRPQPSEQRQQRPGAGSFGPEGQVRFELTDKSL